MLAGFVFFNGVFVSIIVYGVSLIVSCYHVVWIKFTAKPRVKYILTPKIALGLQ